MLRDVLSSGVLTHFATIGLVIFVLVFLATCAWILSRSREEVSGWSRLPLANDTDEPTEERLPHGGDQSA